MVANFYIFCTLEINREQLFGAFFCARAAARNFIKLGIKGSVVFTASMASYRPNKVRIDFSSIDLIHVNLSLLACTIRSLWRF